MAMQQVLGLLERSESHAQSLLRHCGAPDCAPGSPPAAILSQARKRKRQSSPAGKEREQLEEALLAPGTPTQEFLPLLRTELRHHQLQGIRWLASLYTLVRSRVPRGRQSPANRFLATHRAWPAFWRTRSRQTAEWVQSSFCPRSLLQLVSRAVWSCAPSPEPCYLLSLPALPTPCPGLWRECLDLLKLRLHATLGT
jgi:hypothetical protein